MRLINITIDGVLNWIESDEYLKNIIQSSEYIMKICKPYFSHRNVSADPGRCAMKHFWEENRPAVFYTSNANMSYTRWVQRILAKSNRLFNAILPEYAIQI